MSIGDYRYFMYIEPCGPVTRSKAKITWNNRFNEYFKEYKWENEVWEECSRNTLYAEGRYYQLEEDMKAFSKLYPSFLFKMECISVVEVDQQTITFFKNGIQQSWDMSQHRVAPVPPFL